MRSIRDDARDAMGVVGRARPGLSTESSTVSPMDRDPLLLVSE